MFALKKDSDKDNTRFITEHILKTVRPFFIVPITEFFIFAVFSFKVSKEVSAVMTVKKSTFLPQLRIKLKPALIKQCNNFTFSYILV